MDSLSLIIITGTTNATANTETAFPHGGGNLPRFYEILARGNGLVYESKAPDNTNIYLKGAAASIPFTAYVYF